jgi:signal transduction histidine kinase
MVETGRTRDSEFIEVRETFESIIGASVPDHALDLARRRALAVRDLPGPAGRAQSVALLGFAADLLVAVVLQPGVQPFEVARVIDQIERSAEIPRLALAREALQAPELARLSPPRALELSVALLLAFTRMRTVSLWTISAGRSVAHIAHAGDFDGPVGPRRGLARAVLEGDDAERHEEPDLRGIGLAPYGRADAVLVAEGRSTEEKRLNAMVAVSAPTIVTLLELFDRYAAVGSPDGAAAASAERRLKRLRFDLHDGPQQDVILLAEDLRLFRAQLGSVTQRLPSNYRLLSGLDDLQARLVALAGDLRRISSAVESPTLYTGALPDAVAQAADDFTERTGIHPEIRMQGDFTPLTDSQQIALLALVREALNNIREHSDARHVSVSLSAGRAGAEVTITDDGRGFEPEEELVRAARGGHLGLVGMHERVRMLGGLTSIDSRPGGPTTISARIPPWVQGAAPSSS